ncbi:DUF3825 domain-containing protein [Streptomyces sp. NPDC092952]|uniref:DUF3825 domain-containing protein n=1 Tax=Streptomyces sp. NPDC092952 TaxID=3366018 RepID=UPI0037F56714
MQNTPDYPSVPEAAKENISNSSLYEFAWLGKLRTHEERRLGIGSPDTFDRLANIASHEPWGEAARPNSEDIGILLYYITNTFARAVDEGTILPDFENQAAVFNTGLLTENQEDIYGIFTATTSHGNIKPWSLKDWFVSSNGQLERFPELPGPVVHSEEPSDYYFDWHLPLESRFFNIEHLVSTSFSRAAGEIPYGLGLAVKAATEHARGIASRMPGTAVPSWDFKKSAVQILLPLFLSTPVHPDAAVALTRIRDTYIADEVIPLDFAYKRARLVTRPHARWLAR